MVRIPLTIVVLLFAASVGGAQGRAHAEAELGRAQAEIELGLRPTGYGAAVLVNPIGRLTRCDGSRCFYAFAPGTVVTLTVSISTPGTSFARWLGACTGSSPKCTVRMTGTRFVTARFSPVHLYIEPTRGEGSVERLPAGVPCGAGCSAHPYGSEVELRASSCCDYSFQRWSGRCAPVGSSSTCIFDIVDTTETTPRYVCTGDCVGTIVQPLSRDVKAKLDVRGRGSITINGKSCRGICEFVFRRSQPLVLRAYTENSTFYGWNGACQGRDPRCQFPAFNDPRGKPPSVSARFGP